MIPHLLRLESALDAAAEYAIKATSRDPREPGRARKIKAEAKLQALIMRMFRVQRKKIMQWLQSTPIAKKSLSQKAIPGFDELFADAAEEFSGQFFRNTVGTIKDGIDLYAVESRMGLDYSMVNANAARHARNLSFEFLEKVTDETKGILKSAINDFINTPGMTLGDVFNALPFDEDRARRIAITEITRTYADANQVVSEEVKKQFPDVKVVKIWYANQDDIMCEVCEALNNKEAEQDENFKVEDIEIFNPPAHPNCRCWTQVRTRINAGGSNGS